MFERLLIGRCTSIGLYNAGVLCSVDLCDEEMHSCENEMKFDGEKRCVSSFVDCTFANISSC